jgi:hypothetical protein
MPKSAMSVHATFSDHRGNPEILARIGGGHPAPTGGCRSPRSHGDRAGDDIQHVATVAGGGKLQRVTLPWQRRWVPATGRGDAEYGGG